MKSTEFSQTKLQTHALLHLENGWITEQEEEEEEIPQGPP